MILEKLFPKIGQLELCEISIEEEIRVEANVLTGNSYCPCCSVGSSRIHSKYKRHIADLPWGGKSIRIDLTARKFFCDNTNCKRIIFTERFGSALAPYARKTVRLEEQLRAIGFATGGNTGSRLSKILGISASSSTMLRIIRATPNKKFDSP